MSALAKLPRRRRVAASEWSELLQQEVNYLVASGTPMYRIAEKAGVSAGTVSRLYHRETKQPWLSTTVKLLTYFGYNVYAE